MKIIPLEEVQWRDQQEKASQIKVPVSISTLGRSLAGRTAAWGQGAVGVWRGGCGQAVRARPQWRTVRLRVPAWRFTTSGGETARGGWFRAREGFMASSTRPLAAALVSHPGMHACGGRGRARAQGGARWGRGGGAARFTGAGFVSLQRRFFPGRETGSHA